MMIARGVVGLLALGLLVPAVAPDTSPLGPVAVEAQERRDRDRAEERHSRQELAEKVRERFFERVGKELDLSGREVDELRAVLREFHGARMELARDRREHRRALTRLQNGSGEASEADRLLAERAELRQREIALQEAEEDRLADLLTPAELLRFQELRESFNKRVQRMQLCRPPDRGSSRERPRFRP